MAAIIIIAGKGEQDYRSGTQEPLPYHEGDDRESRIVPPDRPSRGEQDYRSLDEQESDLGREDERSQRLEQRQQQRAFGGPPSLQRTSFRSMSR